MLRLIIAVSILCAQSYAQNACRFNHPSNGVIDLSSIGQNNGEARFRDVSLSAASSYMYSFNPCYSFTEQNCAGVAACRLTKDRQNSHPMGFQSTSIWTTDSNGNAVLTYVNGAEILSVNMECASNGQDELIVLGEGPTNQFSMVLRSRCACWNGCIGPQTSPTTKQTTPAPTTTSSSHHDACSYYDSRLGLIDLKSIARSNGIAAFADVNDLQHSPYQWSYNPCLDFTERNCYGVAACQINKQTGTSYSIAYQRQVTWINMNNTLLGTMPTLVYSNPSLPQSRLEVQLVCDRSMSKSHHSLSVIGEMSPGNYLMRLTSRCACWDGCTRHSNSFQWKSWMTIASVAALCLLCLLTLLTCLFCSRPNRPRRSLIINEKTPFNKNIKV